MATFRKRKDGQGRVRYQALIRRAGHAPVVKTFSRSEDAKSWARETERQVEQGAYGAISEAQRRTLAEAIDRYLDKENHKHKDAAGRKQQLEWWKDKAGALMLARVDSGRISELKELLEREPYTRQDAAGATQYKRSPSTVNRYVAALSHVLSRCVQWKWIAVNPASGVEKDKEPRGRVRFLSDDERAALLTACKESRNRHLYPIVMLALLTGARRGELETLEWSQIDAKRRVAVVHETKNGERRVLPLATPAWAALEAHRKVRVLGSVFVFPSQNGKKPANTEEAWRQARSRSGIQDFRFHDLRHSCASYLAMNGATPGEIAEVLGHKTLQMVKRYAHLSEKHVSSVVERMAGNVFKQ